MKEIKAVLRMACLAASGIFLLQNSAMVVRFSREAEFCRNTIFLLVVRPVLPFLADCLMDGSK